MDDEYNDEYYDKYLKYKNKYANLIDLYGGYNQIGGASYILYAPTGHSTKSVVYPAINKPIDYISEFIIIRDKIIIEDSTLTNIELSNYMSINDKILVMDTYISTTYHSNITNYPEIFPSTTNINTLENIIGTNTNFKFNSYQHKITFPEITSSDNNLMYYIYNDCATLMLRDNNKVLSTNNLPSNDPLTNEEFNKFTKDDNYYEQISDSDLNNTSKYQRTKMNPYDSSKSNLKKKQNRILNLFLIHKRNMQLNNIILNICKKQYSKILKNIFEKDYHSNMNSNISIDDIITIIINTYVQSKKDINSFISSLINYNKPETLDLISSIYTIINDDTIINIELKKKLELVYLLILKKTGNTSSIISHINTLLPSTMHITKFDEINTTINTIINNILTAINTSELQITGSDVLNIISGSALDTNAIKDKINDKITELKKPLINGITTSDLGSITLTGIESDIKNNINTRINELNKDIINRLLNAINNSKLNDTGTETLTYIEGDNDATISNVKNAINLKIEDLKNQNVNLEQLNNTRHQYITDILNAINTSELFVPSTQGAFTESNANEIKAKINETIEAKNQEAQSKNEIITEIVKYINDLSDTRSLTSTANSTEITNSINGIITTTLTKIYPSLTNSSSLSGITNIDASLRTSAINAIKTQVTGSASTQTDEITRLRNELTETNSKITAIITAINTSNLFSSDHITLQTNIGDITNLINNKINQTYITKDVVKKGITEGLGLVESSMTDISDSNSIKSFITTKISSSVSSCPPCPLIPTGTSGIPASLPQDQLDKLNRVLTSIEARIPSQIEGTPIDNHLDTLVNDIAKITQDEAIIKNLLTRILNLTNIGEIVQKYYVKDLLDELKNST